MNENISALVDGEATELERARVLRALGEDAGLRTTWERYHLVGSAIRNELETLAGRGLAERIRDQLRNETPMKGGVGAIVRARSALKIAAGGAIAATVAAVAILNLSPTVVPPAMQAKQTPTAATTSLADAQQQTPADQLNALNPYLMQHGEFAQTAGMNGMLSYVRVVGRNNNIVLDNTNAE